MSRTDKDMPWWVRAEWHEPYHRCGWRRVIVRIEWNDEDFEGRIPPLNSRAIYKWKYFGDCDLPAEPAIVNPRKFRRRGSTQLCYWEAEWPRDYNYMSRGRRKKALRHFEFHGPQRTAERDAARRAKGGDWETEFPDGRERSSVLWDLW